MTGWKWRCRLGSALITMGLAAGLVPLGAAPAGGQVQEAEGAITSFRSPSIGGPAHPVATPDGNVWFASNSNNRIARVTPTGAITTFTHPAIDGPAGMAFNPDDGKIWFTSGLNHRIGTINVTAANGPVGAINVFPAQPGIDTPSDLAYDGSEMWVTHQGGIAEVHANGTVTNHVQPGFPGGTDFVTLGADGNIWFSMFESERLGRITTGSPATMTLFNVPAAIQGPQQLNLAPDGNIWVLGLQGRIAKVNTSGVVTLLPALPNSQKAGYAIAPGHDGNMWFFTQNNKIGRMTMAGVPTLYSLNTSEPVQFPSGIVAGPGGNMWFTTLVDERVGYIEGAAVRRPDARTGLAASGPFSGDNVYETTPTASQTIDAPVPALGSHSYFLSVQNDGNRTDSFKIKVVEEGSAALTIKYIRDGVNITPQVREGTYSVVGLAPGASAVIKVRITATPSAQPNAVRAVNIKVKAARTVDVVRFRAQRAA